MLSCIGYHTFHAWLLERDKAILGSRHLPTIPSPTLILSSEPAVSSSTRAMSWVRCGTFNNNIKWSNSHTLSCGLEFIFSSTDFFHKWNWTLDPISFQITLNSTGGWTPDLWKSSCFVKATAPWGCTYQRKCCYCFTLQLHQSKCCYCCTLRLHQCKCLVMIDPR